MHHNHTLTRIVIILLAFWLAGFAADFMSATKAGPPPWSGGNSGGMPPGLGNHSLPGQAWENGLRRFRVFFEIVRGSYSQPQGGQSGVKDDIIYYYHNDHLGTPLFMTGEDGSIVWRREQTPFGETSFERGETTENLRFPGQYYDAETCMHYNYYRDAYSPKLGRYTQPDPIGQGGLNPNASGGRLVQVKDKATQAVKADYTYDGMGRRVKKTAGGVTTYFIYDSAGRLMSEYDGSGAWLDNRVYMDGEPLARLDSGVQNPAGPAASPSGDSVCLTWEPVAGAAYYEPCRSGAFCNVSSFTCVSNVTDTSYCFDNLSGQTSWCFRVRAYDSGDNLIGESGDINVTLTEPSPELPHYAYDETLGGQADCAICHLTPGTFTQGFGVRTSIGLCASCHNAAGIGHAKGDTRGHPIFVNVTADSSHSLPGFGSTSGMGSDSVGGHLLYGRQVVCMSCHNAMQKPHDPGRTWEFTNFTGGVTYTLEHGGWSYHSYLKPVVYRTATMMSAPAYVRERKAFEVPEDEYDVYPASGEVVFHAPQPQGTYVYVTLGNDYLRTANAGNALCTECHTVETHRRVNCAICHGTHGTGNLYTVREKLGTPRGYADVTFTNMSGMGGAAGVCTVCHTTTMYHNVTSISPVEHYDNSVCTDCHPHDRGFPSFTTVFNPIRRWFAGLFETDSAYANPPAWVTDGSLPPGLANHSIPAQVWANGLRKFKVSFEIVRKDASQENSGQSACRMI